MIIDGIREVLPTLPGRFTTRQLVRSLNAIRRTRGKYPVRHTRTKRAMLRLVEKREVREVAPNVWEQTGR